MFMISEFTLFQYTSIDLYILDERVNYGLVIYVF